MIRRLSPFSKNLQSLSQHGVWKSRSALSPLKPLSSITLSTSVSRYCYYSSKSDTANDQVKTQSQSNGSHEDGTTAAGKEDTLRKELETKSKEIIDLKDKYLRSVADFRNLQDRTARDVASTRDFAISRFAKDLLDSVDNFDRALSTVPATSLTPEASNKELKDLHSGLKMTESILMQTLARNGLERFDPSEKGEKFDPNLHEATFMTKMEGKEDGTVFNTVQKGFRLNGRVIRAAKVGVVKNT